MVDVVQLVRASDCGSECRGFESHLPPRTLKKRKAALLSSFFAFIPAGIKKTNTFKYLIYNILLKVHKVVDHNLVNFVFFIRVLQIRNITPNRAYQTSITG